MEVEVVDRVQTAVFCNNWGHDSDGNLAMFPARDDDWLVSQAVQQVLTQGLVHGQEHTGIKFMSGGVFPRPTNSETGNYTAMTLPAMPARLENGDLAELTPEDLQLPS